MANGLDGQTLSLTTSRFESDVTIANTAAETSIVAATRSNASLTAVAKNQWIIGSTIKIKAQGIISSKAVTPGNLTIKLKCGATVVATGIAAPIGGMSNEMIDIDLTMTVRSIGSGGTVVAAGFLKLSSLGVVAITPVLTTTPQTVAQNVAFTLDVSLTWATADPGNTLTITIGEIQEIDPLE